MVWRSLKLAKVRLYWVMMARLHSSINEPRAACWVCKVCATILFGWMTTCGYFCKYLPEGGGGTFSYWTALLHVATGEEVAEVEADTFRMVKHRSTLYTSGMRLSGRERSAISSDAGSPVQDTSFGNLWFKDNVYGLELSRASMVGFRCLSLGEDDTSGPNIYLDSGTGSRIIYQDLAFKDDWILSKYSRKPPAL